jgi:(R)-amidase
MRIEIGQLGCIEGDKARNLARAERAIAEAGAATDLLVLPELFLTGFPSRRDVAALAEPIDGPMLSAVRAAARRKGVAVALGTTELDAGRHYNTTVLIGADGTLLLRYRKTHLFGGERAVFEPGDALVTTLWNGLRVGLLICYDIEFPETARALGQLGAQLLVVTNGNMDPYGPVHRTCIAARALENQAYAVMANRVGRGHDFVFAGGSAVVDPFGDFVLEAGRDEATLRVELDLTRLQSARAKYDYRLERRLRLSGQVQEDGAQRRLLIAGAA